MSLFSMGLQALNLSNSSENSSSKSFGSKTSIQQEKVSCLAKKKFDNKGEGAHREELGVSILNNERSPALKLDVRSENDGNLGEPLHSFFKGYEEDEQNEVGEDDIANSTNSILTDEEDDLLLEEASKSLVVEDLPLVAMMKAEEMKKLQELKEAGSTSQASSQSILKDMLLLLKNSNVYSEITLNAKLAQDAQGKFEVEDFKMPSNPDKTLYRLKVTYTIMAKKDAFSEPEEFSFSRMISTAATTPEGAVLAASHFKENVVVALALKGAGMPGGALENASEEFYQTAMSQKMFSLRLESNSLGIKTYLKSIYMTAADKQVKSYEIPKESQGHFIYNVYRRQGEKGQPLRRESQLGAGYAMFGTEEHLLLQERGYTFSGQESIYVRLEKEKGFQNYFATVAENAKENEERFEKLQSFFINKSGSRSSQGELSRKSLTVIEEANLLYQIKSGDPLEHGKIKTLSPDMQELIGLTDSLSNNLQLQEKIKADVEKLQSLPDQLQSQDLDPNFHNQLATLLKDYQIENLPLNATDAEKIQQCQIVLNDRLAKNAAEIKEAQKATDALESTIKKNHESFTRGLSELYRIQEDLAAHVRQLKNLKEQAEAAAKERPSENEKQLALEVSKTMPDIGDLEKKRLEVQALIDKISDSLQRRLQVAKISEKSA